MKRLAALVAAVVLVVGALWVRDRIDGDDGGDGSGGGGGDGGGDLVLACSRTMASACERLDRIDGLSVRIEDDATTAEALAQADGASPDVDAWLTAAPWAAMVADERELAGRPPVLAESSDALARSPVTMVARSDRAEALRSACGGNVTWACVGDAAGGPWTALGGDAAWGTVRPGLPAPDSARGLVVLAQAVASRLGGSDYASNDFDEDPAFRPWFDRLVGAAKDTDLPGVPLSRFLVAPATFGVVGSLEAESGPELAGAANRGRFDVIYPEPVVTADVVLAPAAGSDAESVIDRIGRDRLTNALSRAGWRVPGAQPGRGVDPSVRLPDASGLPQPGVLAALRSEWEDVR